MCKSTSGLCLKILSHVGHFICLSKPWFTILIPFLTSEHCCLSPSIFLFSSLKYLLESERNCFVLKLKYLSQFLTGGRMVERPFLPIYRLSRLAKMKMVREGMSTRHIGIPGQHCLAGQLSLTKFMLFIWGAQAQESAAQPLMTFMIFSRGPLHQNERYREKLCVFGEFLVFDSNPCYAGEHNLVKILLPKFQRQKRHHHVAV